MPNMPSRLEVHVNVPLTSFSTAYIQDAKWAVHDKVFKTISVEKQSDLYYKYTKDFWYRSDAAPRAPGSESAGGGFHLSTGSYFAKKWAWHMDLDWDTMANQDNPINLERDATRLIMQKMLLRREKLWLATYFAPGIWKGLVSSGTAYDFNPSLNGVSGGAFGFNNGFWASATSQPIIDVDSLINAAMSQSGYEMNTMVVTNDVHYTLKNHPAVLDRIKYTERGIVTEEILAAVFGVKNYYRAAMVANTANQGQAGVYNYMASNSFLLAYVPDAPGILTPAPGYTFAWSGLLGAGALGTRIKKIPIETRESDRIEGTMAFDMAMVGSDLGIFCGNALR